MSSVALHFASGTAFFSGAVCLLIGICGIRFAKRRALLVLARMVLLVGLACVVISATPLPVWAWCVWGVVFVGWVAPVAGIGRASGASTEPASGTQLGATDYASALPLCGTFYS